MNRLTTIHPKTSRWLLFLIIVLLAFFTVARQAASNGDDSGSGGRSIAATKHNLSISGPGTVKAAEEAEICIFCHTPHNSIPSAPLWNRRDPGTTYIPYSSSTVKAAPGQPTGSSLLCLSCHDGTIALGEVLSKTTPIRMAGSPTMPPESGLLGTDLSDDHPISFTYTETLAATRGELTMPATLKGPVQLDSDEQLQCTTCHNPHDDTFGKFLVMSNKGSALCTTCHIKKFWNRSSHKSSKAVRQETPFDSRSPIAHTTVADKGCENCHQSHTAGEPQRLLYFIEEENNCYICHNGDVAIKNIQEEFRKISRHPVEATTGVHDPAEPAVVNNQHVECADCHNPHAARTEKGKGKLPGSLTDVRGVSASGGEVSAVSFEYEICFRCHADSHNKPAPRTSRQLSQTNTRLGFNPSNPSFHPVQSPGRNPDVPSLVAPLTTSSTISCSDCHNNNAGPEAGGIDPKGPHGSVFSPLLERQYMTRDNTAESSSAYALCYKCHSRDSILNDESFKGHNKHIREENTSCNVCHDPHGISQTQGNSTNNSKLINFDTYVVSSNSQGKLRFESRGRFEGVCYLSCHGKDHDPDRIIIEEIDQTLPTTF